MYLYRLLIFQMTMLLAILLVFSLSWSQQLPVGMTSVTSEPTIEPWIPSEPTTEVPSTVDPTMEIPSTVEPTTEVSVTSEPTTEAPTLILFCPHDSPLPESPIDSVVSIPCDRDQFGDKTYMCILVNSHPEWTLTESTCRSPRPSVGTVDISFRIRFVGLVLSPYRGISSIIRFLLSRHLGIDAQYVTVSRWTDSTRVLVQLPRYNIGSAHFILLTTTPTLHPSYLDPQLMPETRDSYSLAQIPVCTTLWYEPVHTIPRFSVYLFVPCCCTN